MTMTMISGKPLQLKLILILAVIFYGLYFTIGGNLWGTLGLLFTMIAVGILLVRAITELARFKKQEGSTKEKVIRILKPFGLALLIVVILAGAFTVFSSTLRSKIGLGEPLHEQLASYLTGGEQFINADKALEEIIKEKRLIAYTTKNNEMAIKISDHYSPDFTNAKLLTWMLHLGLAVDMANNGVSVLDVYYGDELYAHFEKGYDQEGHQCIADYIAKDYSEEDALIRCPSKAIKELQRLEVLDKFGSPTEAVGGLSDEVKKQIENDLRDKFEKTFQEMNAKE